MKRGVLLFICLILLTGCWDQRLLKNARIVFGSAYDLTEDGEIKKTVVIRTVNQQGGQAQQGGGATVSEFVTAEASTVREARREVDRQVSGEITHVKNNSFILGEEMAAKSDLQELFDGFYRDPRSPLGTKVFVVEGEAEDVLRSGNVGETIIGEYLYELLNEAELLGMVDHMDIQLAHTVMLDEGRDVAMPYLSYSEENERYIVDGIALFHDQNYTGKVVHPKDAPLLLMMDGWFAKRIRFVKKVNDEKETDGDKVEDYINIAVTKMKRKIKVKGTNADNLTVNINLNLKVRVDEYAKNNLKDIKVRKELDKKLSAMLTKDAQEVINTLQEANSDYLGIGRRLIAYHPKVWKELNWEKDYPNIKIIPNVKIEIVNTGILT
ncbi:Ger(x)C family spore germination protein [Bacillus tianshenii]|nr:Ger(x)C family spore germination protein [Bacillus tianshenii]